MENTQTLLHPDVSNLNGGSKSLKREASVEILGHDAGERPDLEQLPALQTKYARGSDHKISVVENIFVLRLPFDGRSMYVPMLTVDGSYTNDSIIDYSRYTIDLLMGWCFYSGQYYKTVIDLAQRCLDHKTCRPVYNVLQEDKDKGRIVAETLLCMMLSAHNEKNTSTKRQRVKAAQLEKSVFNINLLPQEMQNIKIENAAYVVQAGDDKQSMMLVINGFWLKGSHAIPFVTDLFGIDRTFLTIDQILVQSNQNMEIKAISDGMLYVDLFRSVQGPVFVCQFNTSLINPVEPSATGYSQLSIEGMPIETSKPIVHALGGNLFQYNTENNTIDHAYMFNGPITDDMINIIRKLTRFEGAMHITKPVFKSIYSMEVHKFSDDKSRGFRVTLHVEGRDFVKHLATLYENGIHLVAVDGVGESLSLTFASDSSMGSFEHFFRSL